MSYNDSTTILTAALKSMWLSYHCNSGKSEWVGVVVCGMVSEHLSTSIICSAGCLAAVTQTCVCVCTTSCNKNQVGETPKILKINFNVCVVHAAFQSLEKSSSIAVNLKRETTFYERTP